MAAKKSLNAKNLEALGAQRLAQLLIEISSGDAATKRRLRLELAGAESPAAAAHEVRKRLATIARSRSFIDWQTRRGLVADLETQRRAIVEQVADRDPTEALDLMWRFLELATSVLERCDDSSGTVSATFDDAVDDLGKIAAAAKAEPRALADRAYRALIDNGYGQYDDLIQALVPSLGEAGLEHLKQRMIALAAEPVRRPRSDERRVVGMGTGGVIYADEIEERSRKSAARLALQEIADAQGDVDAFVDQYDEPTRRVPRIAAEIAERLLMAGRVNEALDMLDSAEHGQQPWPIFEWEGARISVLDALGRSDEAQAARWSCFERALSAPHLQRLSRAPRRLRRRRRGEASLGACLAVSEPAPGAGIPRLVARPERGSAPRDRALHRAGW